jgi:hypothetical protein
MESLSSTPAEIFTQVQRFAGRLASGGWRRRVYSRNFDPADMDLNFV